jgi:hypothetical protein
MKISTVIITYDRVELLERAIVSVINQIRKTDYFYVISNSTNDIFLKEKILSEQYEFKLIKNNRTDNYAGALNKSVEEIIKEQSVSEEIYFASLDDDDEWLPEYLNELEISNDNEYDLLTAYYLRYSPTENILMKVPDKISEKDFLIGNPGIGGSNTFVRLTTLLKAGAFDEALHASVDRDFFIRVFQQNPSFKVVKKHLVTAHTDKNRTRLTTDIKKKENSFQIFYYKYKNLMSDEEQNKFFKRAENFFSIKRNEIDILNHNNYSNTLNTIDFKKKKDYQFIIGFIAGNEAVTSKITNQIVGKKIPVDLVLIIEDVKKDEALNNCKNILTQNKISYLIIEHKEWKNNLNNGYYGSYFKQFAEINSIPLGRTILHHHLYTATKKNEKPIYWIIDDDISFNAISNNKNSFDLFDLINENIGKVDAIIGSISNDPPIPALSCMRVQLIDYFYSNNISAGYDDIINLRNKPDYYYDLTDIHTDHLEIPLYYKTDENSLLKIFSGKAVSRPVLQKDFSYTERTIAKRGANTLVFNRDLLKYYPVINLKVNNKFARRGDLLWALLNQVISGRKIIEHTFSIDHNRPISCFNLNKEIEKSAYDIIGYAFNKGILKVINEIKSKTIPYRPKDILGNLWKEKNYQIFYETFSSFMQNRRARFLMNYYRIAGLSKLLSKDKLTKENYLQFLSGNIENFENILSEALNEGDLKLFLKNLIVATWTYSKSITELSEAESLYKNELETYFKITGLSKLGKGAEGIVYSDKKYVYKIFFNILDVEWAFLKDKSHSFRKCEVLDKLDLYENNGFRFIRYSYQEFKKIENIKVHTIVSFLKFCKQNNFVFTNIKPDNFIQVKSGKFKLIDYGKSFEPFTQEKFINSIKRAFLLIKYPSLNNVRFKKLTAQINIGEIPKEIINWKNLYYAIEPRKKEDILDTEIIKVVKSIKSKQILDYGSGKCKTTNLLKEETQAEIFVYDINKEILKKRCDNFPIYSKNNNKLINYFDTIILNIVLCEVKTDVLQNILGIVVKALNNGGHIIVSICNPDFAHIKKTEFQNRLNIPLNNETETIIKKISNSTNNKRVDYHRPTKQYIRLFKEFGLSVINTIDTKGVDIGTLEEASDFKVFLLKK